MELRFYEQFSCAWSWLHGTNLATFSRFPSLGTGCIFSRAWQRLNIFLRLALVVYFPALGTGCIFSRAWHRLHIFPRLAPAAYFPALGTCCIVSVPGISYISFPHLMPATFPALSTANMFSRTGTGCEVHQLHVFSPFVPVKCYPALGTTELHVF